MPFASDKQRRYLYSQKPDVARKFAAHMQQGGDVMPQPRMSLFEMIEEYRASLPQGRGAAPQAPLPMAPAVNYGDPMTHPGEPMGQDQIPAWLTEGEFVVNAEAMSDPMNAQVVNDINTQGQMMQDQGLGFGMNRGGYVNYMQEGGLAGDVPGVVQGIGQGLHEFASSPAGAAVGQRIALIGAGDLAGAAKVSADDFQKGRGEVDEIADIKEIAAKAGQAIGFLNVAAQKRGGDKDAKHETSALDVARTAGKISGLFEQGDSYITSILNAVGGEGTATSAATLTFDPRVLDRLVQERVDIALQEATEKQLITVDQEAAMQNLIGVTTELTTVALAAQGSGPKTDFDFIVAARSITNLKGSPKAIASNFQRLIANANKTLSELGQATVPPTQFENPNADIMSDDSSGEGDEGVTIDGLEGKWISITDAEAPADVKAVGTANPGQEVKGDDGMFYVYTAGYAYGGNWYRRASNG